MPERAARPTTSVMEDHVAAPQATEAANKLVGVWALGARRKGELFDRDDLAALSRVAQQATVLLDYSSLHQEQMQADRLRRFLSPQVAELIVSSGTDERMRSHRRQIAVVFCDLRGFTAFAEAADPEEVMGILHGYHEVMGDLIHRFEGTVGHFAGDGLMVFFNDPLPCPDPVERAVRMSVAMIQRMDDLTGQWRQRGYELGFGVGIAFGDATLGTIGFEGRFDYAAIGPDVNLAARLSDHARSGHILVSPSVYDAVKDLVEFEPLGNLDLKGFRNPVTTFNVVGLKDNAL